VVGARDRSHHKALGSAWGYTVRVSHGGYALTDRRWVPTCVGWACRSTPWTAKAADAAANDTGKVAAAAGAAGIELRDAGGPDGHSWRTDERGAGRNCWGLHSQWEQTDAHGSDAAAFAATASA